LDRLGAAGNQVAQRLLSRNPTVAPADGETEREAERAAAGAPTSTGARHVRPNGALHAIGGGQPLPAALRKRFESRFGAPLDHVRVHTGEEAAGAAAELDSRAFAYGSDLVFNRGQYAPGTPRGERLLAHELTHVVQQQAAPAPSIARQPNPPGGQSVVPPSPIPPFNVPFTGLTLIPGPLASGVLGSPIPVPGSLRLTNALGVGGGPTFVVDLNPHQLVGTILGDLQLASSAAEGTPLWNINDPAQQQRTLLRNVVLRLDTSSGRLRGSGTLLVPTSYPPTLKPPTEIDVQIESTELGAFSGRLGYGPLHSEFQLRLHYDVPRLERAASPVFAPEGGFAGFWSRLNDILRAAAPGINLTGSVGDQLMTIVRDALGGRINGELFARQTLALLGASIPATADLAALRRALSELGEEFSHPGYTLTGGLALGPIPLSRYRIEAPTTRPIPHPLPGAPTDYPSTISAYGTIIAPAGSITSIAVPAFGAYYSRFGERSGFSAYGGLLPTLSTTAISAGQPFVNEFPVYAFAELSYVRRATGSLDLGIRLSAQTSTSELFGPGLAAPSTPLKRYTTMIQQYQESRSGTVPPLIPTVGLTVYGRWRGLP
jgi:hypothetical protein